MEDKMVVWIIILCSLPRNWMILCKTLRRGDQRLTLLADFHTYACQNQTKDILCSLLWFPFANVHVCYASEIDGMQN